MQIIIKICSLLLLVILATYGKPNKKHHNTCDFDNIQAGDNCKIKWMDLKNRVHPTQAGIGMACKPDETHRITLLMNLLFG